VTSGSLLDAVQHAVGRPVSAVTRAMSPYSSSFRIEEVTVDLAGGAQEVVVLKDLSWSTMLAGARAIRDEAAHEPVREVDVYRHFLGGAPAGPPRMLGWDAERHWLFLERVEGLQLRHVGELDAWREAARWAGRFHARFAGHPDVARRLPSWSAERLGSTLHAAALQVERHGTAGGRRVMAQVADHHQAVVARLLKAPATLVHGQLYPSNVLVAPARICVLDWETAAHGPGVLDLAALVEGDWDTSVRDQLCHAYLDGRDGVVSDASLATLGHDLACARLQLCLQLLALPQGFRPPADHAADWVARAGELAEAVAA
jgi:hypothetical protein